MTVRKDLLKYLYGGKDIIMEQKIFDSMPVEQALTEIIKEQNVESMLVVADEYCIGLPIAESIKSVDARLAWFSDFQPNPDIESVRKGIRLLTAEKCTAILAIGGGSAMDVAKAIKMFSAYDPDGDLPVSDPEPSSIPLIAIPTTAGTGSEATRYSVVYKDGAKQSLTALWIIPEYVIMLPELLKTLPEYQKKCTLMDALCHSVESFWSVNSTDESKGYSRKAMRMILDNLDPYLAGDPDAAKQMLIAANYAGKAINITQTTAGHAMSYKVTKLFGTPHGHAAAICVEKIWPYMLDHLDDCVDGRGKEYLEDLFKEISGVFTGREDAGADLAPAEFSELMKKLGLKAPEGMTDEQLDTLVTSVNPVRLKNNPVALDEEAIRKLYIQIFRD